MNKRDYQRELDALLLSTQGENPSLLLHCCCAPCSSYVLEYLAEHFAITAFYYNPNISPESEYQKRVEELERLLCLTGRQTEIPLIAGEYHPDQFYATCKGLESLPEGGERCFACYSLRLRESAKQAAQRGCAYFTTTLSISPYKNAQKLNELGEQFAAEYGVKWLPSDFKKRGGYQRSILLSKEYGLYRQDYCGCSYSKLEAEQRKKTVPD